MAGNGERDSKKSGEYWTISNQGAKILIKRKAQRLSEKSRSKWTEKRGQMYGDLAQRLHGRVLVSETGCHEWQGYVARNGYGQIGFRGGLLYTHRAAWMLAHSDPGNLYVLHKCDNRRCVNPDHLFLGTFNDNMADMKAKNRHAFGERNGQAKLTAQQAREIKNSKERTRVLARRYNVADPTVCDIRSGRNWAHI